MRTYASRDAMWLVVGDVLQKDWLRLLPAEASGRVDMDAVVAIIDDVYRTGGDESLLHELIREALHQLMKQKMIPKRGEPWTVAEKR